MHAKQVRAALLLMGAVVVLALVNVSYPARFFAVEANASLAHLHIGLLLAVALLVRDPLWLRVGVLGNLLGWQWRAWHESPGWATAFGGCIAMLLTYALLRAAAMAIRWPAVHGRATFGMADVVRAVGIGCILLPLALGASWLLVAWAVSGESPLAAPALSAAAQTVLAKCFGTLILAMPLVLLASESPRAAVDSHDAPHIDWLPLLGAGVPMVLAEWAGSSQARDGALALFLDYRLILAGALLVAVVKLPLRVSMTLLAAAQAVFAIGLAVEAGRGRDFADVLDLLRAAFEVLLMQLLVLATYVYNRERNDNLREVAATNEALTQRNQELQRFVMVASHDLQEPLRKIMTFGDRVRLDGIEALTQRQRDSLERIDRSAQRMRALINGLLDYSRVSTAQSTRQPVELAKVVDDVLDDLAAAIEQCAAEIVVGPLPAVQADPLQMHQLLQNLIGNALRYRAPERRPRISVEATLVDDGAGGKLCRLRVADNGIGFEPDQAERIFGLFQRLHDRDSHEGTGLGLAIVRRIAEQHQGSASASGRPGEGAEFVVTLRAR